MNDLEKKEQTTEQTKVQMEIVQHSASVTQHNSASEVVDSLMSNFDDMLNITSQYAKLVIEYEKVGGKGVAEDAQKLVNDMRESFEAAKQQIQQIGIPLKEALNADNKEISDAAGEIQADLEKKIEGITGVSQELDKAVSNIALAQDALNAEGMIPGVMKDGTSPYDISMLNSDTGINNYILVIKSVVQITKQYTKIEPSRYTDYHNSGQFERDQAQRFKALNSLIKNIVNAIRPIINNLMPYVSCVTATIKYLAASRKANGYAINHAVKDSMMNFFRKVSGILQDSINNAKTIIAKTIQFAIDIAYNSTKRSHILIDCLTFGAHSYLNMIAAKKADKLKNSIGNDAAQIDNNNGGTMSIQVLEYTTFYKFQMRMDELSLKLQRTDEKAYWKDIHDSAWKDGKSPVEHVISAFVYAKEKTSLENIKRCVNTKSAELDQILKDKKQEIEDSIKSAGAAIKNFPGSVAKKVVDGINTLRADALVNEARLYARMAETHVNTMHMYENKYQKLYSADIEIQSQMEKIRETLAKLSPDYEGPKYLPKPYDASAMIAARDALYAQFKSHDITIKQFAEAAKALEADYKKEEKNFKKFETEKAAIINSLQAKIELLGAKHALFENRMNKVAAKCIKEEERTNNIINDLINKRINKAAELNTQRDYNPIDNVEANVPHENKQGDGDISDNFTDETFEMA